MCIFVVVDYFDIRSSWILVFGIRGVRTSSAPKDRLDVNTAQEHILNLSSSKRKNKGHLSSDEEEEEGSLVRSVHLGGKFP